MAVATALLLLFPAVVAAHAELDVPTPADGSTVEGTPVEIFGTFSQAIDPDGSSLVLRDTANTVVARGGPDPDDDKRMAITDLPDLAPGTYEVQWTTVSAEDGELARGTWSFTAAVAIKTPGTPAPTATASASPAATPATPSPTTTAEPTPAASPSASPAPIDPAATAGGDAILPIIAALAIVLIAAVYLVSRRGRPSAGA